MDAKFILVAALAVIITLGSSPKESKELTELVPNPLEDILVDPEIVEHTIEPIEESSTEPEEPPTVASIETPVVTLNVEPEVENDFIQFVVDNYKGQTWHMSGRRPVTKKHLVGHGFPMEDLNGRSQHDLGRLHGAIHTNSIGNLRKAYNGGGKSTSNRSSSNSGRWVTVCKGNRCSRKWVSN